MNSDALLVIDMLNDFIEDTGTLFIGTVAQEVLTGVKAAIREARDNHTPIIYICDHHLPNDAEFQMFPPHCIHGTEGAQIVTKIAPREEDRVILKRRYSAFFGTDLDAYLRELGRNRLLLVGVCTNICVLYTAADARMLNYEVVVRKDAVGSFDEEAHQMALKEMENILGVKVL